MKKDIEIEEADEFDEAEEGEEEPIAEPDSQILPTLRREGWCISQVGFKLIVKDSKRIDINSIRETLFNSDLSSIAEKSVLREITKTAKKSTQIPGPFMMQVIQVRNICQATYSHSDSPYLLMVTLSDGFSEIKGIVSKQHIAGLDLESPGGLKIELKSVQLRNNILLLNPSCVRVLGGRVVGLDRSGEIIRAGDQKDKIRPLFEPFKIKPKEKTTVSSKNLMRFQSSSQDSQIQPQQEKDKIQPLQEKDKIQPPSEPIKKAEIQPVQTTPQIQTQQIYKPYEGSERPKTATPYQSKRGQRGDHQNETDQRGQNQNSFSSYVPGSSSSSSSYVPGSSSSSSSYVPGSSSSSSSSTSSSSYVPGLTQSSSSSASSILSIPSAPQSQSNSSYRPQTASASTSYQTNQSFTQSQSLNHRPQSQQMNEQDNSSNQWNGKRGRGRGGWRGGGHRGGRGHGSFGSVFLSYNFRENQIIATKIIPSKKFELGEWKSVDILWRVDQSCPFLLNYIRHYHQGSCIFIHTDFANMKKNPPIPLPSYIFRALFKQILVGLQIFHAAGLVHRDIKCDNILLHCPPGSGHVYAKISDFGFSNLETTLDPLKYFRGTLPYMAPEILRKPPERITQKVDIFALGITMIRLLTHKYPLNLTKIDEFRRKYQEINMIELPSEINDNLLHDLLTQMLEFNPNKRISVSDALKHPYFTSPEALADISPKQQELADDAKQKAILGIQIFTEFDMDPTLVLKKQVGSTFKLFL
ncbi:MAG: putative Serine/threonine-protein kinase SAPK1 [Streblomastix strix]|uniref:Putative Serine/threonine-protein kinase SAPK1 n=1 Tax=Streblomastix strix TaxID=222440 RepID=A0A5J4X1M4_9EUKA|nr:MAG: putative Serine/threonine-protein kinase SAPK1 [Streblomastix strix]